MNDKSLMRHEEKALRDQLEAMRPQFEAALHGGLIKPERFVRVVMTAVNQDPDLLAADRRSFFNACLQCAQDGLVPDKREAALVVFKTKEVRGGKETWIDKIQYMPMYQGLMKKVRSSGELAKWVGRAVYEKDTFHIELGDDERITHTPYKGDDEPGPLKAVYAIATLKDGTVQRDWMTRRQIERVKARSKTGAKDKGPWKTDFDQMAIKTVIRRQAKQLPLSPALMEVIARDDALTTLDEEPEAEHKWRDVTPPRPRQDDYREHSDEANTSEEPVKESAKSEQEPQAEDQGADDADDFPGDKPWPQEKADEKQKPKPKSSGKAAKPAQKQASEPDEKVKQEEQENPDPHAKWTVEGDTFTYLPNWTKKLKEAKAPEDVDAMKGVNSERIAKFNDELQKRLYEAADQRKDELSG